MQAKAKRSCLTQHRPFWLMLRFIKHTFTESVFYSHKLNLLGSSALIVIYKNGLTSKMMQHIASKSKHPATVFLNLNEISKPRCKIRWFNQKNEIKRCGHGTLAAAKCLINHFNYCPKVFVSSSDELFNINIKRQKAHLKLQTLSLYKTNYTKELTALFSLPIKATYCSANKNSYTVLLFDSKEDLDNFSHESRFNEQHSRIEMHLVSKCDQSVVINNQRVDFIKGESIHTENSHKYTLESFKQLAGQANLNLERTWQDDSNYFALCLLRPQ